MMKSCRRAKSWWNDECQEALISLRESKSLEDHKAFRAAVKAAKRAFFDALSEDIAVAKKRPWDVMSWVKPRALPSFEAISFEGEQCVTLDSLWGALHSTFNSASDRVVESGVLDTLLDLPAREWIPFSLVEL